MASTDYTWILNDKQFEHYFMGVFFGMLPVKFLLMVTWNANNFGRGIKAAKPSWLGIGYFAKPNANSAKN